jgi:hypothetical protein
MVDRVRLNTARIFEQRAEQRAALEREAERRNLIDRALIIVMEVLGRELGPRSERSSRYEALTRMVARIHERLRGGGRIERLFTMRVRMEVDNLPGHQTDADVNGMIDYLKTFEDALFAANRRNKAMRDRILEMSRVVLTLSRSRSALRQTYLAPEVTSARTRNA